MKKRVMMEKGCEIKPGIATAVSTSIVEIHLNNDADVPTLSVTAPSEDVSEIEDNLGSSTSQTPARDDYADDDDAETYEEAKKMVDDVLNLASEILQTQTVPPRTDEPPHPPQSEGREDEDENRDEIATVASLVAAAAADEDSWQNSTFDRDARNVDPEVRTVADNFVKDLIEKAWHEANTRMENLKDVSGAKTERFEIAETLSSGDPDKRRPWYRRARTSVRKLLHRLCICGRAHR